MKHLPRIFYVNGRYLNHSEARVHVEDRGYQLSDGVYEVAEIAGNFLIDLPWHLDRLDRSLGELRIDFKLSRKALVAIIREVALRNRIRDGLAYLQITRGVSRRDHAFPDPAVSPALVVSAKRLDANAQKRKAQDGVAVITVSENRWERVDIKTIGLLSNVLARQEAKEKGAFEAWYVDENGFVTEGAATNAWIVDCEGELITRPADIGILRGITRARCADIAEKIGLRVTQRAFTVEEAKKAREAFITSATSVAVPVIKIDGITVANGHPGSVTRRLQDAFRDHVHKMPIWQ